MEIEDLLKLSDSNSPNGKVETSHDWRFITSLWNFWKKHERKEYTDFLKSVQHYRNVYADNKHHVKEEKGGAQYQHTFELPMSFYFRFMKFFPRQDVASKAFIKKFIEVIPETRLSKDHHKI